MFQTNTPSSIRNLSFDATTDDVRQAILDLTQWCTTVTASNTVTVGAYLANEWTVLFPADAWITPTALSVKSEGLATGTSVAIAAFEPGTPDLAGTFKVAIDPYCDAVEINTSDTPELVANKLANLHGVNGIFKVEKFGDDSHNTLSWRITFDPDATPGDVLPLRIVSTTIMDTAGISTSFTENVKGDTLKKLFGPLPTAFTALPVWRQVDLKLEVNNIPSSCAMPDGVCTFKYEVIN